MMSIKTMATPEVDSRREMASRPVLAERTVIPLRSRTLLNAKMLRTSSSTTTTFFPTRASSEWCKRSNIFDHYAAGQFVKSNIFFERKLASGKHDHRQIV